MTEDSLSKAKELEKQADTLKREAREMEARVRKSCEHHDLVVELDSWPKTDLLVVCPRCNQWARFKFVVGSRRGSGGYGAETRADAETFVGAVQRRFALASQLNPVELEKTEQFGELLAGAAGNAGWEGFMEGFRRGLEKAREVVRSEGELPREECWAQLREEAFRLWKNEADE
jgi:hypothetical protein